MEEKGYLIRRMNVNDMEAVADIDKRAFKREERRDEESLKMMLEEQKIALVCELDGNVTGYIFNHQWGEFGWFGPLGVDTEYKGMGIGKSLVKEAVRVLEEECGVRNVGLATMPESGYNIGFYTKLGFCTKNLVLNIKIPARYYEPSYAELEFENISLYRNEKAEEYINIVRNLSEELCSGLDMTVLLFAQETYNYGELILIKHKGKPRGFICLYECQEEAAASTIVLAEDISDNSFFEELVKYIVSYAAERGKESIYINVDTMYYDMYSMVLNKYGGTIKRTLVSLIKGDNNYYSNMRGILMTRLAR